MTHLPIAVVATGAGAFGLSVIAWIALIISREAGANGLRLRWIDAVAEDLASVIAAASRAAQAANAPDRETAETLRAAVARLHLRFDSRDPRDRFLTEIVERIEALAGHGDAFDRAELDILRLRLASEGRARLMAEREAAAGGSPLSRVSALVAGGAVTALLFIAVLALFGGVVS